jgi:membrane protease YdiL (CAAX protease family)
MLRKPIFWLVFTAVSIAAVNFAVKYFAEAFPVVSLDLQMDRQQAFDSARQLAQQHNWKPEGFKQAASFSLDREVQNFVELEAGGNQAFRRMLTEGLYSPYTWHVRHFRENETHEVRIRFTPKGEPYGFVQKLPEKDPGPTLAADSARAIAERAAIDDWRIDLIQFQLAEKSQETRPGGRIDHTFVYERPGVQIGDGRYRLRLVVGGDRLTELTHFVRVPEAFSRRYEEMRSANDTINVAGSLAFVVLYVIGGCGIGLFYLLRERWVIWRQPLFWGLFVSFLQVLAGINQWPLTWMSYDTALSSQGFLLQQIMLLLAQFFGVAVLFTLSFMAAESLSRRAFPHHIQQWRLWSREIASSPAVLGRTIGGYLLVGIFFAYEVILYFFANKTLGWWSPSDALIDPNVLATYFPWLSSIAISLQAGFWEESLFRAVPIAGAALLGERFGRRNLFIAGAMIIQALIFGAGHAGYANQPPYARVVELIIPSLMFGGLYISFGLLPAIVLHFAFDVVWFALPLFVAASPALRLDQALVIILTLVPLWIVLISRWRHGRWADVSEENRNRAWVPPLKEEAQPAVAEIARPGTIGPAMSRVLLLGGIAGLACWIFATKFQTDSPTLTISRLDAEAAGRNALTERGIDLSPPWQALASAEAQIDAQDRFVWQKGGKENYRQLLGTYLSPPHWKIRFVRFEGDVAERAEEYEVYLTGEGNVLRVRHQLPEARPGDSLTVEQTRRIAHEVIKSNYQMDPLALKEISAVAAKRPARQDWTFEFSDTLNYPLPEGEARLAVEIAGNEVMDAYRYVHVPEEWARAERNRRNLPRIIEISCIALIVGLVITGVVVAIVGWTRKNFSVRVFLGFLALLYGLNLIGVFNNWPSLVAQFSTAQPFKTQAFIFIASSLVSLLLYAAALALILGFVDKWKSKTAPVTISKALLWGLSFGVFAAGLLALIGFLAPSLRPLWGSYGAAGTYLPLLEVGLDPVGGFIMQTTLLLFIFAAVDHSTNSWSQRKALFSALFIVLGLIFAGARSVETIPFWLASGLVMGVILLGAYLFVFRFHLALVPLAMGVMTVLGVLKQGIYQSIPAALPGALIAIALIGLFAFYWFKKLAGENS